MRYVLIAAAIFLTTPVSAKLCKVTLDSGEQLEAQAALTRSEQIKGLSGSVRHDAGLIMAWDRAEVRAVWMKGTDTTLTAAFIGEDGRIQSIQNMTPNTDTVHSSHHPVVAIIEVTPSISERLKWEKGGYVTSSNCFRLKKISKPQENYYDPK